jgi:hypothetical protein
MNWAKQFRAGNDMRSDNIDTTHIAERLAAYDNDGNLEVYTEKTESPPKIENVAALPPLEERESKSQTTPLVDALDKIEASWLEQLGHIKNNAEIIERKVKACVVGLRQDIARLELLEQQAMKEATRGRKVAQHFANSLDQIKGGR